MSKCIFCNEEFVKQDREKVKELGLRLQKQNDNLLAVLYQHVFSFCPKCKMVELVLSEDEIKILRENKVKVFETLNNKNLNDVDTEFFVRQAEVKGYACELLGDREGAILGYKASVDLLNMYINDFLNDVAHNIQHKDGHFAKILSKDNMLSFEYAKDHRDFLNRLIFGLFDENTFSKIGILGMLIYLDTIVQLVELDIDRAELMKLGKNILTILKDVKLKEELVPVLEQIENKLLLAVKTYEQN